MFFLGLIFSPNGYIIFIEQKRTNVRLRYPTMYHASFPECLIHGALNICDLFATNWKIVEIARFFHV